MPGRGHSYLLNNPYSTGTSKHVRADAGHKLRNGWAHMAAKDQPVLGLLLKDLFYYFTEYWLRWYYHPHDKTQNLEAHRQPKIVV